MLTYDILGYQESRWVQWPPRPARGHRAVTGTGAGAGFAGAGLSLARRLRLPTSEPLSPWLGQSSAWPDWPTGGTVQAAEAELEMPTSDMPLWLDFNWASRAHWAIVRRRTRTAASGLGPCPILVRSSSWLRWLTWSPPWLSRFKSLTHWHPSHHDSWLGWPG